MICDNYLSTLHHTQTNPHHLRLDVLENVATSYRRKSDVCLKSSSLLVRKLCRVKMATVKSGPAMKYL